MKDISKINRLEAQIEENQRKIRDLLYENEELKKELGREIHKPKSGE